MTSIDIQLARDQNGTLPYLTHWSRHEPASIKRPKKGNTDHWTKTKHKNLTLVTLGKDKKIHSFPGVRYPHEEPPPEASQFIQHNYNIDGAMKHVGSKSFTRLLVENMNGNWPGNYHTTRPIRRHQMTSIFNDRARDGFEYWWKEPQPMSASSKNWIGSGGNVLGTARK